MAMRLVCVLGIVCLGFAMLPRTARAEDGMKRIGVVNVSRVFNTYEKVKDVQKRMESAFDTEQKAIQKEGQDLKVRETEIQVDQRPRTDLAFFQKVQAFELDKLKLEVRFQKLAQQVEEQRKNEMKGVLNDIKNAIRIVGTGERFDLVLRAPEFEDEFDPTKAAAKDKEKEERKEPESAADLVRKFRENPVLYFSSGVDVTQKVVDKLNDDYKKAAPATK